MLFNCGLLTVVALLQCRILCPVNSCSPGVSPTLSDKQGRPSEFGVGEWCEPRRKSLAPENHCLSLPVSATFPDLSSSQVSTLREKQHLKEAINLATLRVAGGRVEARLGGGGGKVGLQFFCFSFFKFLTPTVLLCWSDITWKTTPPVAWVGHYHFNCEVRQWLS